MAAGFLAEDLLGDTELSEKINFPRPRIDSFAPTALEAPRGKLGGGLGGGLGWGGMGWGGEGMVWGGDEGGGMGGGWGGCKRCVRCVFRPKEQGSDAPELVVWIGGLGI